MPQRLDARKKVIESGGGKLIGFYLTMGKYDQVSIIEAPGDEAIAAILLSRGSGGNSRTETLKAFPEEQYRNIIAKVQ